MIILIPLIVLALGYELIQQFSIRLKLTRLMYAASAGMGWAGYSLVGWLAPHGNPHDWHYAIGSLVALAGLISTHWLFAPGRFENI